MSKVIEVTDQSFEEEVLNSDLPTEVDFWAPWCAYSEAYTCLFVPVENWLEVPIYAGEKDYHLSEPGQ